MVSKRPKGSVSVYQRGNALWLNFRYQGKRQRVPTGLPDSPTGRKAANAIAKRIESDIAFQKFSEEQLDSYLKGENPPTKSNKESTFLDLWEEFYGLQQTRLEETTLKSVFKDSHSILQKLHLLHGGELFKAGRVNDLVAAALQSYSPETLRRAIDDYSACGNWAVKAGKLPVNPWKGTKSFLPKRKPSRRSKKAYSEQEARYIIDAFRSGSQSYYVDFVEFLLLTGCRTEEAIALTCGDLFTLEDGAYLKIDKAYSKGVLKGTKTGQNREFKCNPSIKRIVCSRCERLSEESLVFPSQRGRHLDLKNFTNRCWKPTVKQLVDEGKVREYLPTYNCRHTAITRMLKSGLDPTAVAAICGNSPEVIFRNYSALTEAIAPPEIY